MGQDRALIVLLETNCQRTLLHLGAAACAFLAEDAGFSLFARPPRPYLQFRTSSYCMGFARNWIKRTYPETNWKLRSCHYEETIL